MPCVHSNMKESRHLKMSAFCYIIRRSSAISSKCVVIKLKKSFAVDSRFFLMIFCTGFFGAMTYGGIIDGDVLPSITIGGAVTLLFIFGIVIIPKLYVADEEGISIYYLPFVKEYFKWNDIKRIEVNQNVRYNRSSWVDCFWKVYKIIPMKEQSYKGSKYHSIFHSSEIFKTLLSKRMINKHWDGNVEDDSFSFLKNYYVKQKKKNIKYDLTEAKQKEKWARDTLRQIVAQCESKANLYGKTIDASCTYFTDDEDSGSRPKENYSYVAEIFVEKENDEESSFYITAELLFVSYGKKNVKITENKNAFDEIADKINEAIVQR